MRVDGRADAFHLAETLREISLNYAASCNIADGTAEWLTAR
jgi:hypothetical protein